MVEQPSNPRQLPEEAASELNDRLSVPPKIPMRKWTHPDWTGWLVTATNVMPEDVCRDYGCDSEGLEERLVWMTKEEIDALPEFDGF